MKKIYKEALKDADMVYKEVKLKMSFLYWVTNYDTKMIASERIKEDILNKKAVGIRDTIAQSYTDNERQFYWKTFHDEYSKLNRKNTVIP